MQDNLQGGREEQVFLMITTTKAISSSAPGEWSIYSVWKKLLHTLLIVKCFNIEFSDFLFQL